MILVYLTRISTFRKNHANARKNLDAWKLIVEKASWRNKQDVLSDFPKAKIIPNNRARFEIVHNTFRLVAYIHYEDNIVEIRFIGTHTEYDRIDPATI